MNDRCKKHLKLYLKKGIIYYVTYNNKRKQNEKEKRKKSKKRKP